DADSSGGIFERSALSEPDHSVLGCMVRCSAWDADQAANRGAVDDSSASLLAHLAQLILHAIPHAAEIDGVYAIEFCAAGISGLHSRGLHAGIVVRRIQATEGGHGLFNHFFDFCLVCDVAADGNRLVT